MAGGCYRPKNNLIFYSICFFHGQRRALQLVHKNPFFLNLESKTLKKCVITSGKKNINLNLILLNTSGGGGGAKSD